MISNTNNRTLLSVAGTTYDFTFRIDDISELKVYGIDADGVSTLLTTGFSISFDAANEEGTVEFDSEPSTYAQVLMLRSKAYTQNTDVPIRAGFSEEDIENALDHIVMLVQQLKEITDYCVKFDLTTSETGPTLPTPVTGNALIWDAAGNLVNSDAALVGPTGPTGATGPAGADGIFAAIASQAEAEAGVDNTKGMTPLRVLQAIGKLVYPVGSIYINDAVSTNPATLLGFGTWAAITDRMIIGVGATFTPAGATGGTTTKTIAQANLPSYNLSLTRYDANGSGLTGVQGTTNGATPATHNISSGGSGTALDVMNPYYAAYVWRRTA